MVEASSIGELLLVGAGEGRGEGRSAGTYYGEWVWQGAEGGLPHLGGGGKPQVREDMAGGCCSDDQHDLMWDGRAGARAALEWEGR